MLFQNPYPICEFDASREPLITPQNFIGELPRLPPRCVITFFRGELQELAEEQRLPVIGQLHSEVLDIPIYRYRRGEEDICTAMPFLTAPGAACTVEELYAGTELEQAFGVRLGRVERPDGWRYYYQ